MVDDFWVNNVSRLRMKFGIEKVEKRLDKILDALDKRHYKLLNNTRLR